MPHSEAAVREVAKFHTGIVKQVMRYGGPIAKTCLILPGGETSVTVKGSGRGGRNAEFLLSLLIELEGAAGVYALAVDAEGFNLRERLENNDAYSVFAKLDRLLMTGLTRKNVNDFRAILIVRR